MTVPETRSGQPLPDGWRWVRLGEVATYWNGRAFKPDEWREEGTPIIRIENLNSAQTTFNYFQGEVRPQNCINNGDLLVSWSASLDAYIWDRGPAVLNQHIFKVDEDSSIVLRDFFYYMLRHTMTSIRGRVHGATMQHITKPKFEKIEIPLPPLDKQRQIAAVLRDQMASVEQTRAAAQARVEAVKALPAAFLRRVFPQPGQPLPYGWRWVKLGEVLQETRNGLYKPDTYYGTGTRILKMFNIGRQDGSWNLKRVDLIELTEYEERIYGLDEGDILFNRVNSNELVGKCAVIDSRTAGAVFESKNIRLRLNPIQADPFFVATFMNSQGGRNQIQQRLKQIVGQATVNRADLDSFEIPLPFLPEQQQIAEELREQMAAVEKARAVVEEELATINALTAALLRRAFNGEL